MDFKDIPDPYLPELPEAPKTHYQASKPIIKRIRKGENKHVKKTKLSKQK